LVMKKDLVIAVLATFCLTATLLMIIPTRSSPSEYDPWVDINDDGKINIADIFYAAKAFGTSGDPTKPVVIAGYESLENVTSFVLNTTEIVNFTIPTVGFRTITVSIYAQSKDSHQFEIFIGHKIDDRFTYSTIQTLTSDSTLHVVKPIWYQNIRPAILVFSYEVAFSELWLSINNISTEQYLIGRVAYHLNT